MTTAPLTSPGYLRGSPPGPAILRGQVVDVLPGALIRPESPSGVYPAG